MHFPLDSFKLKRSKEQKSKDNFSFWGGKFYSIKFSFHIVSLNYVFKCRLYLDPMICLHFIEQKQLLNVSILRIERI